MIFVTGHKCIKRRKCVLGKDLVEFLVMYGWTYPYAKKMYWSKDEIGHSRLNLYIYYVNSHNGSGSRMRPIEVFANWEVASEVSFCEIRKLPMGEV